jgi:MFS family permease
MTSTAITVSRSSSRWTALALIVAAQFMVVVDMSIVNVALATIKNDLHFSQANLQWVVTAYAIVFGGFLLLGGRLADLLGRRRVFLAGIALFTLGSVLSGLAWSAGSLVVFRGPLAPDDHLPGRS